MKQVYFTATPRFLNFDLMQFLWTRFDEIAIPMDGLRIGEQLSWLSERDMK